MPGSTQLHMGCCITPHGFGHAARTAAVIKALSRRLSLRCTLLTTVPEWFFADGGTACLNWHEMQTDVGLIQKNSLEEDMAATRLALDCLYPFHSALITRACERFAGCDCIFCDIAPLGIVVAKRLGIPSILLENFTWDWIYQAYRQDNPFLDTHIVYLEEIYQQADHHLQATPVCRPVSGAVSLAPVFREGRKSRDAVRAYLGLPSGKPVILLTMGGIGVNNFSFHALQGKDKYVFLLAGTGEKEEVRGNVYQIPARSSFYHPDLIRAADLVVGKLGYSTVAEIYGAGTPFAFVGRPRFPESAVLARFAIENNMGREIESEAFVSGQWLDRLDGLLGLPRREGPAENGADQAAAYIQNRVCS